MVALSLALAHEPELLILDEPTSGLDALVRREFLESMVDRAAQGQTVLLSSHQIGEVERVADVVAIVRKSKLLLVQRLDEFQGLKMRREKTVTLKEGRNGLASSSAAWYSPSAGNRGNGKPWFAGADDEQFAAPCAATTRWKTSRSIRRAWRIFLSPTCRTATGQSTTTLARKPGQ